MQRYLTRICRGGRAVVPMYCRGGRSAAPMYYMGGRAAAPMYCRGGRLQWHGVIVPLCASDEGGARIVFK
jgi:hypothetical protein